MDDISILLFLILNSQKRLKRKEYATADQFADDVELVFSNALAFNQEHTLIWEDALTLRVRLRLISIAYFGH